MSTDQHKQTTLQMLRTAMSVIKGASLDNSLIDISKPTRVEPLTVISQNVVNLDCRKDVLMTTLNLFSGYYLQAVSIYGNVDKVKILKSLDRFNPNRNLASAIAAFETFQLPDNYEFKLPGMEDMVIANEAGDKDKSKVNLAVGKEITVDFVIPGNPDDKEDKDKNVKLNMTVKLEVIPVPSRNIVDIIANKKTDISLGSRWHKFKMGNITFWNDLVLANDLVGRSKLDLANDTTDVASTIQQRASGHYAASVASSIYNEKDSSSLAVASNIFVITEAESKEVANRMGGKWKSKGIRDKIFKDMYCMIIVVINPDYDTVTFYFRDAAQGSTISLGDLTSKTNGPDILEVMKSLSSGSNINF